MKLLLSYLKGYWPLVLLALVLAAVSRLALGGCAFFFPGNAGLFSSARGAGKAPEGESRQCQRQQTIVACHGNAEQFKGYLVAARDGRVHDGSIEIGTGETRNTADTARGTFPPALLDTDMMKRDTGAGQKGDADKGYDPAPPW